MTEEPLPPGVAPSGSPSQKDAAVARAKQLAQDTSEQVLAKLRVQIQQGAMKAGDQLDSAAGDVRVVGADLLKSGREGPAKLVVQAADKGEDLGRFMKTLDADKVAAYAKRVDPAGALRGVEDFGRRRAWPVIGGSLALGYLASRLIKASSEKRYQATQPGRTPVDGHASAAGVPAPGPEPSMTPTPADTPPPVRREVTREVVAPRSSPPRLDPTVNPRGVV